MPKLRVLKSRQIKDIPTQNPYNYAGQVVPIYEIHRVLRSEMVELSCRSTHCIKARSTNVHGNDNLYELFRKFTNKDVKFMRQWLKLFSISNQQNLEVRARRYLASKGLAFDNWMTSITDGMKGDILVLYTLCMLFDKHAIVHLRHGLVWSTLEDLSQDHYADLKKCELHLCYVGRGLFIELMERKTPLEIVKDTEAVQSLIIGELSTTEEQTIQLIETASKGLAFDNWMTSITDGMKGDILVLYTLCMLFDKHAIVHLRHGLVWSTLEDLSQDHYADLKKCELHLCYVGRGLFIELMERKTPLEIVKDTEAVQSLIIGELSTTEEQTIRLIETAGLGNFKRT